MKTFSVSIDWSFKEYPKDVRLDIAYSNVSMFTNPQHQWYMHASTIRKGKMSDMIRTIKSMYLPKIPLERK